MRVLMIGPDVRDIANVASFGSVWGHYVYKGLTAAGIEVVFTPRPAKGTEATAFDLLDLTGIDHVMGLGQRYFHRLDREVVRRLRARVRGYLVQVSDGPQPPDVVDCTFTVARGTPTRSNLYVGWAADPELFSPTQDVNTLSILVDHPYYGTSGEDWSAEVDKEVERLVNSTLWRGRWRNIRVRRLVDGGAQDWSPEHRPVFTRKHIPVIEIAKEYGQANIFLGTHRESLGWVYVEMAVSGALPVFRRGAIPADRAATIRHVSYAHHAQTISWEEVFDYASPINVRGASLFDNYGRPTNRWEQVMTPIISYLER